MKKLKNIFLCGVASIGLVGCAMEYLNNDIPYSGTVEQGIALQNAIDYMNTTEYGRYLVDVLILNNVKVKFDSNLSHNGEYNSITNTLYLKRDYDIIQTLIHESVHALQDYDGFTDKANYTNKDEYIILKLLCEFDAVLKAYDLPNMYEGYVVPNKAIDNILGYNIWNTYVEWYSKYTPILDLYDVDELKELIDQRYSQFDTDMIINRLKEKIK